MSADIAATASTTGRVRNGGAVAAALALLLLLSAYGGAEFGWRRAALMVVAGALGLSLYHAAFGFTAAWRQFVRTGDGSGLRAQMAMLAIATLLIFPVLDAGSVFGRSVGGFVAPAGVSVAFGAFLFGIGMQLGGGCASGTLYTAGGGNTKMVVTLAAFVAGSYIATTHLGWWLALPALAPTSTITTLGLWPALALNLAVFGLVTAVTYAVGSRGERAQVEAIPLARRLLRGPWPLIWGAVALAVLNFATVLLAGRPWGITSAFALWGAHGVQAAGFDPTVWPYWAARAGALDRGILADTTSAMNIGIMAGALMAAGLAGRFAPGWRIAGPALAGAIVGGLMMGYGARLAFGCNIGAYFGGVVSGSLHGWLWLATGFVGSILGTHLRAAIGIDPARPRALAPGRVPGL